MSKQNETKNLSADTFVGVCESLAKVSNASVRKVTNAKGKVKVGRNGKAIVAVKPTLEEAKEWLFKCQPSLALAIATAKQAKDNAIAAGDAKAMKGEAKVVTSKVTTLSVADKKLIAIAAKQMKRALNLKQLSKVFATYLAK